MSLCPYRSLKAVVRKAIGPIATPDFIVFCDLPKVNIDNIHIVIPFSLWQTRSGKIMRRILRKVAAGELDGIGDTSTLADPAVVDRLAQKFLHHKH